MNKVGILIILGLLLLTSVNAAPTFELISNTDQCLVNCEAVLKMTTDNVGFALPIKENTNFKLEFLKDFNAHDIEEYTIHLGTEQIYYEQKPIISTRKEKVILDYNINGCPSKYVQQALSCEKEIDVKYISGYYSIEKIKIVYQDFFKGISVLPNSIYYIRVRARKKPKLGPNNVDWIVTIAGQKLTQYSWFNSNWKKRKFFTITNESTIDANINQPMDLNSQHFDYPNICTQTNFYDCLGGLLYNGSLIPLSMENIDNNKAWFKLPIALSAGATTPSGEAGLVQYYDNSSASAPPFSNINMASPGVDLNIIGSDQNITLALWHLNGDDVNDSSVNGYHLTEKGTIDTNSETVKYGLSSADGFNDSDYFTEDNNIMNGRTVFTIELDFYWVDNGAGFETIINYGWASPGSFIIAHEGGGTNAFQFNVHGCGTINIADTGVPPGTWHHLVASVDGSIQGFWIDGSGGTTGCSTPRSDFMMVIGRKLESSTYWSGNMQNLKISNYGINSDIYYVPNGWTPNATYFTKTIGAEETPPVEITNTDLFQCGNPGDTIDLNINSDLNIIYDFNASNSDQNIDSIIIYYTMNHTGDDKNSVGWIRDEEQIGWRRETINDISWAMLDDTDGNHYQSSCEDDHAYKHYSYNLDPEDFESNDGAVLLDESTDWVKVLLTQVRHTRDIQPTDTNVFVNFSFDGDYIGIESRDLTIYFCNDDYADPTIQPITNCLSGAINSATEKAPDNYYSFLAITDSDANSLVGMNLNPDMNFWVYFNCANCDPTRTWNVNYRDINSNIDRVRNWETDGGGVGGIVATDKSIDAHFHWQVLKEAHNFVWVAQISDNGGTDVNSQYYIETIESVNLPPLIIQIINPIAGLIYSGVIDLNVLLNDPNGDSIVVDINLLDVTGADVNNLGFGLTVFDNNNAGLDFNTLLYPDGIYSLAIRIRETATSELFEVDFNMDGTFTINNFNNPPTLEIIYPNGGEEFIVDGTPIILIGIKITDSDSNSFLLDLNFYTTGAEGNGTIIIIDVNTDAAQINCLAGTFDAGRDCNISWGISGIVDGNYFILGLVRDDFGAASFDASDASFQIITPPDDAQLYTQRFVNSNAKQTLSPFENQLVAKAGGIESLLFVGIIIIVIAVAAFLIGGALKR